MNEAHRKPFMPSQTLDFRRIPISEEEPLLLADAVMQDWRALREHASGSAFVPAPAGGFPGLRAALPDEYVRGILFRIDPVIRHTFFAGRSVKLVHYESYYSIVTLAPEALRPSQKIPHVDVTNSDRIALLHYLCEPHFGGTAFFRQSTTGLERIGPAERSAWKAARAKEVTQLGREDGYLSGGMRGYEQICKVAAMPDRLIAYRSHNLHSGIIEQPEMLSADPLKGRLTATFFLDYVDAPGA